MWIEIQLSSIYSYQQYAAGFFGTNPNFCLVLDMGLGKTVITLTALNDLLFDSFEAHKVLVVAPLRVARDTSLMKSTGFF